RRVGDGFFPRQLHFIAGEHQHAAAQLPRRHVEGNAGAGGLLVEDHGQHLAFQRLVGIGHGLGPAGTRQLALARIRYDGFQRGAVMVRQVQKMPGLVPEGGVHWAAAFSASIWDAVLFNTSMPSRASASLKVRGGSIRTTLSPAGSTIRPLVRAMAMKSELGSFILSPTIRPCPRTPSNTLGCAA